MRMDVCKSLGCMALCVALSGVVTSAQAGGLLSINKRGGGLLAVPYGLAARLFVQGDASHLMAFPLAGLSAASVAAAAAAVPTTPAAGPPAKDGDAQEQRLTTLKRLRDKNPTEDEYQQKRREVLRTL